MSNKSNQPFIPDFRRRFSEAYKGEKSRLDMYPVLESGIEEKKHKFLMKNWSKWIAHTIRMKEIPTQYIAHICYIATPTKRSYLRGTQLKRAKWDCLYIYLTSHVSRCLVSGEGDVDACKIQNAKKTHIHMHMDILFGRIEW